MTIEIREYLDVNGESVYGRWFDRFECEGSRKG